MQCLRQRSQAYSSNVQNKVFRRFAQTDSVVSQTSHVPRSRKFARWFGLFSVVSGGTYLCLKEQYKRKVRVTAGGFIRFLR